VNETFHVSEMNSWEAICGDTHY